MNLKPCPFCGGTDVSNWLNGKGWSVEVECQGCHSGITASWDESQERFVNQAIEIWNTRQIEDELNKRIEELEAKNTRLTDAIRGELHMFFSDGEWIKKPEYNPAQSDFDLFCLRIHAPVLSNVIGTPEPPVPAIDMKEAPHEIL